MRPIATISSELARANARLESLRARLDALLQANDVDVDAFRYSTPAGAFGAAAPDGGLALAVANLADTDHVVADRLLGEWQAAADQRDELREELLQANLREYAGRPGSVERPGAEDNQIIRGDSRASRTPTMPNLLGAGPRAGALRAIEAYVHAGVLTAPAADRLDRVVRAEPDGIGANAAYLASVSGTTYLSAFGQVIRDPMRASIELTAEERLALRQASEARANLQMVALGTLDGGEGGYPIPFELDPTMLIVGDGAADPLRALCTTRTIISKSLTIVTGAEVAASYGQEGTPIGEVLPEPIPVKIPAERGGAFVRLTFELLQDLRGSAAEIARLLFDAKAVLEAEKMSVGAGADAFEPEGILRDLAPFDSSPTDPDDLRAVQEDVGPRYQANSRWMGNVAMLNAIDAMVAAADPTEATIVDANGNVLRKPASEVSFFPAGALLYGDPKTFVIVDRLGASLEPTGVHFSKDTGTPSGHRGFMLLWRSGSKRSTDAGLRLLGDAVVGSGS